MIKSICDDSDLTNHRFGHLLVLHKVINHSHRKNAAAKWLCKCDCGNLCIVRDYYLRIGHNKSCGCSKYNSMRDLTGKIINGIFVLNRIPHTLPVQYKCRCICGNNFITRGSSLLNGHTKSCGCRKKQLRKGSMVGKHFGDLTVLKRDSDKWLYSSKKQKYYRDIRWFCECSCGRTCIVSGRLLRNGDRTMCSYQHTGYASYGEMLIAKWLKDHHILFTSQKTFNDLKGNGAVLRFDFCAYLHGLSILIECQGLQHYKSITYFGGPKSFKRAKHYDRLKRNYVDTHDFLKLITLDYSYSNESRRVIRLNLIKQLSSKIKPYL